MRRLRPWLFLAVCILAGLVCHRLFQRLTRPGPLPPGARAAAVGALEGIDPVLRRVFNDTVCYVPVPEPGPSDWLAQHHEPGQTYPQWLAADYQVPDATRRTVCLQPVGALDGAGSPPAAVLERFTAAYFGLPVRVLPPLSLDALEVPTRQHQGVLQARAPELLDALRARLPADGYCLLGLTMTDLYPKESWNFVFGMASLRGRSGVFSFARYAPGFYGEEADADSARLLMLRSLKVLVHETGHMFGIQHCVYWSCVMNGSNHLAETDRQPLFLCPVCLRKLQSATGFAPLERYRDLAGQCAELGLQAEADWLEQRRAWIEGR